MMNRFAELLFWAGRYMERANHHARLIDVHYHMRHELYGHQEREYVWERLVELTGDIKRFEELYSNINAGTNELTVLHYVTFERSNCNSILSCVQQARNNIRTLRQLVPAELWDIANAFYLWLKDQNVSQVLLKAPHLFYQRVREWATLFNGAVDSAMVRGQEWDFIQAGKYVERTDNTLRIIKAVHQQLGRSNGSEQAADHYNKTVVLLKSVGGFEAFRRQYAVGITFGNALEYLLLNNRFPQSAQYALNALEGHLKTIELPGCDTMPLFEAADRLSAAMQAIVERVRHVSTEVDAAELEKLLHASSQLGDAVTAAFFQPVNVGT